MSSDDPLPVRQTWQTARADGAAARARGEPRDPAPYLPRYGTGPNLRRPADAWLNGYDEEDERLAVEAARPRLIGEVEWRPVKRMRDQE